MIEMTAITHASTNKATPINGPPNKNPATASNIPAPTMAATRDIARLGRTPPDALRMGMAILPSQFASQQLSDQLGSPAPGLTQFAAIKVRRRTEFGP